MSAHSEVQPPAVRSRVSESTERRGPKSERGRTGGDADDEDVAERERIGVHDAGLQLNRERRDGLRGNERQHGGRGTRSGSARERERTSTELRTSWNGASGANSRSAEPRRVPKMLEPIAMPMVPPTAREGEEEDQLGSRRGGKGCERTELAERDDGGALRHLGLVLAVGLDGDERVLEDAADADADELFEQEQGEEVSAARACARAVNRRRTIWYPISLAIDECSSTV